MNGLFVGLATLDFIYLSETFPSSNEKIVALDTTITAGGPATNAAITFRYFDNEAILLTVIGNHPIGELIAVDLETYSLEVIDLNPWRSNAPPVSSIIVTPSTGDRAVISLNAVKSQASLVSLPPDLLAEVDIILLDGHQLEIAAAIIEEAKEKQIPVVLDGGSWKPGLENLIGAVDYAICSANFMPPNCSDRQSIFHYLQESGVSHIAITQGKEPIVYWSEGKWGELAVTQVEAIDTLAAGDIFHGAFCHYILHRDFISALVGAANIAGLSCQYFGPRQWMK